LTEDNASLTLPESLVGERVRLVAPCMEDAPELFGIVQANLAHLDRFLPWPAQVQVITDTEKFISDQIENREASRTFAFLIRVASDGGLIGVVGVDAVSWTHRHCEIGYWLTEAGEGHGYMSDAVRTLETALFAAGMHRIEIKCEPTNVRSAGIPTRLGYTLEGTLRDHLTIHGQFVDSMLFAKLATDG